jgi:DNA-binding transcriptional regulator YhcF (GntR family)
MTADLQMQRAILALVLREDPDVLTLPALAGRVLVNPRGLVGGVALARALRELDDEGLVFSDGVLVRPSRPALHVKRLLGGSR